MGLLYRIAERASSSAELLLVVLEVKPANSVRIIPPVHPGQQVERGPWEPCVCTVACISLCYNWLLN